MKNPAEQAEASQTDAATPVEEATVAPGHLMVQARLRLLRLRPALIKALGHPSLPLIAPGLMLCANWLWGEIGLALFAIALTATLAGAKNLSRPQPPAFDDLGRLDGRDGLITLLNSHLERHGRVSACMVVGLDDPDDLAERLGHRGLCSLRERMSDRINAALRGQDQLVQLDDTTLALALSPAVRFDLETLLRMAGRMQQAMADPVILDGVTIYVTGSVGFAASDRLPHGDGETLFDAAEAAMIEARRNGPGSIRAYSQEMHRNKIARNALMDEMRDALELGQILPWFQPQISTDTGAVTGFEALARWNHPDRGVLSPGEFIAVLDRAGLMERLGEVMLYHTLTALRAWDRAGFEVPNVGVNFSASELRLPHLADKITWELDRFDIAPDRLTVEVLESVISTSEDDVIQRNIAALAQLGCRIDLDDFGTGHASITSLRRFSVSRIKIDRSFVMKVDRDPDQQRMVAAILTMSEQLGLETLGEGVESSGEHTMLAQLGCDHVQGFGIGRPMPFAETLEWLQRHNAKLDSTPMLPPQTSLPAKRKGRG
ncbi:MAG: GGDEF domain-containing phosphodiesterase [Mangrovicoccus sp.]|nr:GGDEF domain-containing phosphodiesterase [Mangrovicoccus sp.]